MFSLLLILLEIHLFSVQSTIPKYCNMEQVVNYTWCDEGETVSLPRGSSYSDRECSFYVVPYGDTLNATRCPFSIPNISTIDNNCYRLFYPNGSIRNLNIKMEEAPYKLNLHTATTITPFNSEEFFLYCPLYGNPSLEITWCIPFNYTHHYDGLNFSRINHLASTEDREDEREIESNIGELIMDEGCDARLGIAYNWQARLDGDYYCTGRNKLGSKTVLVANVNNGSLCLSSENFEFLRFENLIIELQSEYKVSEGDMGSNFTMDCELLPFSSNVRAGWIKANMDANVDMCTHSNATYGLLSSDEKYSVRERLSGNEGPDGPKCTKVISLTIHEFDPKDEGEYSCLVQICSLGVASKIRRKSSTITSDSINTKTDTWVFSLTSLPILIFLILLGCSAVLIYVHRYRLIRWYIAWRREEPRGNFEFDFFICMSEEYDSDLLSDVEEEIVDKAINSGLSVLWPEHEQCNLVGLSHYVSAAMLMKKCRKFIFVVDEKFGHCYFCKQMVELATDRSSGKNLNIILPIKWTAGTIVPVELMRYRYLERETGSDYFREIANFLEGRSERKKYRRTPRNYQLVELNTFAFVEEDLPAN